MSTRLARATQWDSVANQNKNYALNGTSLSPHSRPDPLSLREPHNRGGRKIARIQGSTEALSSELWHGYCTYEIPAAVLPTSRRSQLNSSMGTLLSRFYLLLQAVLAATHWEKELFLFEGVTTSKFSTLQWMTPYNVYMDNAHLMSLENQAMKFGEACARGI